MFGPGLDLGAVYTPQIAISQTASVFRGLGLISTQLGVPRLVAADVDRFIRQRILGSRADIPLGVPVGSQMLQRAGTGLPTMGGQAVAQSEAKVLETITGAEESGVFDDIFGGIGDVAGNLLEGINSVVEGVASVVGDVAATAGQVGEIRGQFETAIEDITGQVSALPALIRPGTRPIGPRPGQISPLEGAGVGAAVGEFIEDVYDYFTGDEEPTPMEGELLPAGAAAMCDMAPENFYYGWNSASQTYVLKKKRRRRRKMLATPSDLKQLAALKGVLGQGKAFETWIATRSV